MTSAAAAPADDERDPPYALVFIFNTVDVEREEVRTLPGLQGCSVVEVRDLGVPLQPSLTPLDRTANVLVCVLAVVQGAVGLELGKPCLARAVQDTRAALVGFHRSSVVLVARQVSRDVLSAGGRPYAFH